MTNKIVVEHLSVCTGSAALFGPFSYGGGAPTHQQRCYYQACEHRREVWHQPRTDLPEPAGDFPTEVEWCYCCARTLISSGSKFSSFFCDECRADVIQLRKTLGSTFLPLGRHSLCNGEWLTGADMADPQKVERFIAATRHIDNRIDRLLTWQRGVVRDNVEAMGYPVAPYVSARDYRSFASERSVPKAELFRQLCRFFGAD